MGDSTYTNCSYSTPEVEHRYGENVHLLSNPVLLTQLAKLCSPKTVLPEITTLVRDLYKALILEVIANEFPRFQSETTTRMAEATPKGVWTGEIVSPNTKVVTAGIARAGTLPSQIAFEILTQLMDQSIVRQDHIYMARVTDESGSVTGVSVAGSKIGGDIQDAIVLLPDPMGATGGSLSHAISMYKEIGEQSGAPQKIITLNLIITPEYVKRITTDHPNAIIYGLRLDRGLSPDEILQSVLGTNWDKEVGLNELQYIVPGAGGVGEILNNSFV